MRNVCYIIGALSILLGGGLVVGAILHEKNPVTAGIPAYVGLIFVVFGLISAKSTVRKHVMHVASLIALLLALGSLGMSVPKMIQYYGGNWPADVEARVLAWWGQLGLAVLMITFVVLAVRSFIAARKARTTGN